jgi:hypothetical protein
LIIEDLLSVPRIAGGSTTTLLENLHPWSFFSVSSVTIVGWIRKWKTQLLKENENIQTMYTMLDVQCDV